MSLGSNLRNIRGERQLSLRDVERLAKEKRLETELSSGYLSMLEGDMVKGPSPHILYALATIFEVDFIELMKEAGYIPDEVTLGHAPLARVAFRGAASLDIEQQKRIQRMIDFELNETQQAKRKRKR